MSDIGSLVLRVDSAGAAQGFRHAATSAREYTQELQNTSRATLSFEKQTERAAASAGAAAAAVTNYKMAVNGLFMSADQAVRYDHAATDAVKAHTDALNKLATAERQRQSAASMFKSVTGLSSADDLQKQVAQIKQLQQYFGATSKETMRLSLELNKVQHELAGIEKHGYTTKQSLSDFLMSILNAKTGAPGVVAEFLRVGSAIYLIGRATQAVGQVVGAMIGPMIENAAQWEKMGRAYAVLAGGSAGGNEMVSFLRDLNSTLPVTTSALDKASRTLLGFGFSVEEIKDIMPRLIDLTQGNSENFEHLALVYGQVRAQGKAMQQDMYQFVNAGVPIMEALAEVMQKPTSAIREMVREGSIGLAEFEKALKLLTDEGGRFHDYMKDAGGTFEDSMRVAVNNVKLMFGELGETWTPILAKMAQGLADASREAGERANLNQVLVFGQGEEKDFIQARKYLTGNIAMYEQEIAEGRQTPMTFALLEGAKQNLRDLDKKMSVFIGKRIEKQTEQALDTISKTTKDIWGVVPLPSGIDVPIQGMIDYVQTKINRLTTESRNAPKSSQEKYNDEIAFLVRARSVLSAIALDEQRYRQTPVLGPSVSTTTDTDTGTGITIKGKTPDDVLADYEQKIRAAFQLRLLQNEYTRKTTLDFVAEDLWSIFEQATTSLFGLENKGGKTDQELAVMLAARANALRQQLNAEIPTKQPIPWEGQWGSEESLVMPGYGSASISRGTQTYPLGWRNRPAVGTMPLTYEPVPERPYMSWSQSLGRYNAGFWGDRADERSAQQMQEFTDSFIRLQQSFAESSYLNTLASLGEALAKGADGADAMANAFRGAVSSMFAETSKLMFLKGLALIGTAETPLGIALIAGSGMLAMAGGGIGAMGTEGTYAMKPEPYRSKYNITVNNNVGARIETTTDSSGNVNIDVSRALATPAAAKTLRANYGIQRRAVARS